MAIDSEGRNLVVGDEVVLTARVSELLGGNRVVVTIHGPHGEDLSMIDGGVLHQPSLSCDGRFCTRSNDRPAGASTIRQLDR